MTQSYETYRELHEEEASGPTPEQIEKIGDQAARSAELSEETKTMLDEIDEVLEENALEFMEAYIQKGGQ